MKTALAFTFVGILASVSDAPAQPYVVEYWADNQPRALPVVKFEKPPAWSYHLEDLPLVMSHPAMLHLGDATYRLDQEGLYRIREGRSSKIVGQSILYKKNVWRFAGHLSRLYVYGDRHLHDSQAQWDERARHGEPLSLQCGYISMFVQHHLSQQHIPSRLVGCATGSNWKHFDDGHALMEICDPAERRWILFDPTLGARLKHDGHWLDLLQTTRVYRSGGRPDQVDFLNAGQKIDPLTDYAVLYGKYGLSKAELAAFLAQFKPLLQNDVPVIHRWYGRMMQIPILDDSFSPESDAEDALLRTLPTWKTFVRLSTSEFRKRFYDQPCCPPGGPGGTILN